MRDAAVKLPIMGKTGDCPSVDTRDSPCRLNGRDAYEIPDRIALDADKAGARRLIEDDVPHL